MPQRPASARRRAAAVMLAGIATFGLLYSTQAILPALARDHQIGPAEAALSVSLATIGLGAGLLVAAPLSDRMGRTTTLHASLLLASLLGIGTAFVDDWTLFLVLRLLQGLAMAGVPAVTAVYLREELPPAEATRATAVYILGTTIGGLSGRIVPAGLLQLGEAAGLSGVFAPEHLALLGTSLLGVGCALGCRLLLPPARGFTPRTVRLREIPGDFGRVLSDPVLIGLCAISALMMGAFLGTFNALGFRLEAPPHLLPLAAVALLYLVYPLGGLAGVRAGRLAARHGPGKIMPWCALMTLIGVGLIAVGWLPAIVLGVLVMCTGFFSIHSIGSAWAPARAIDTGRSPAHASAIYMVAYYAGSSAGGSLTPAVWAVAGWPPVLGATSAMVAAALLVTVLVARRQARDD